MNLTTLEITSEEATAGLAEYTERLRSERTREDEAIAMAYRAAKRGHKIIMLPEVIRAGGFFDSGHPRLAIMRADALACWVRSDGRSLIYGDEEWCRNNGALVGEHSVRVRSVRDETKWMDRRGTVVPSIPPRHRPRRNRLHLFHILWEVEAWDLTPPSDPALVRHLRGDAWSVIATWDLTELERAVLSGRV